MSRKIFLTTIHKGGIYGVIMLHGRVFCSIVSVSFAALSSLGLATQTVEYNIIKYE